MIYISLGWSIFVVFYCYYCWIKLYYFNGEAIVELVQTPVVKFITFHEMIICFVCEIFIKSSCHFHMYLGV